MTASLRHLQQPTAIRQGLPLRRGRPGTVHRPLARCHSAGQRLGRTRHECGLHPHVLGARGPGSTARAPRLTRSWTRAGSRTSRTSSTPGFPTSREATLEPTFPVGVVITILYDIAFSLGCLTTTRVAQATSSKNRLISKRFLRNMQR